MRPPCVVRGGGDTATSRDPLHPDSFPRGVRDAWATLSRSARPLGILAREAEDLEDAEADVTPGGAGAVAITATMIEHELARERRHVIEEYAGMNDEAFNGHKTTNETQQPTIPRRLLGEDVIVVIVDDDDDNSPLSLPPPRCETTLLCRGNVASGSGGFGENDTV